MGCGCRAVFSVLTIIICVILFLLSGWYWWYIDLAVQNPDVTAIVLYAISGVLLIVMAIIGIAAVFKRSETLICYFAIVMMVMFVFSLIQVALTVYSLYDCANKSNPFTFICDLGFGESTTAYWIPTITILVGTLTGFIFALILKCLWKEKEDNETYY